MTEPGKLRDPKMGYFGAAASYGGNGESKPQLHQCVIDLHGGADNDGGPAGISQHANSNYSLSAAEMESLAALCDTFLPSVAATDGSASEYFETSASAAGTPERVRTAHQSSIIKPLFGDRSTCMHVNTCRNIFF